MAEVHIIGQVIGGSGFKGHSIFCKVWSQDIHGRNELCGYGFCHIPTSPGITNLECPTWLPEGSQLEQFNSFFAGGAPRLRMEEVAYTPGDRFRLQTAASGVVLVQLGILMKDMDKFNISTG